MTFGFGDRRSIQLSYGRVWVGCYIKSVDEATVTAPRCTSTFIRSPALAPAGPPARSRTAERLALACAAICTLTAIACAPPPAATGEAAPTADGADASGDRAPPAPQVTDDATELLFSFVDAHGSSQSVGRVADVPEAVRARVLVVDLARSPEQRQAHRYAFFADLTAKKPDGTYPVTVVSRYAGKGPAAAVAALPPPAGTVVVYSAVWCGYCKRAKAWLKAHDVPFVERDVEKTPGAQAELDAKLRAANVAGGGIPVTDWAGTLVMGFDQKRFEALRAQTAAPPAP